MSKKDQHLKARFQLRLEEQTLDALKRKAAHLDVPLNHLIAGILEREVDDATRYHQQMAAKQSFMSMAMLNVLAARLLPQDVRKDVFKTIQAQANSLFGANPEIPESILMRKDLDNSTFVTELFALFERHAENHYNIRPE
jgi:hypothetical protein